MKTKRLRTTTDVAGLKPARTTAAPSLSTLSIAFVALLATASAACTEEAIHVDVRSLEQSGAVTFACLNWLDTQNPARPLDNCARFGESDYEETGSLYAFVTQSTRGELAVINLTQESVVDLNPSKPGFNFLPVGAIPTGITATPGGTAIFIGSAEANRESIWIVPSRTVVQKNPHLTSFAACALPHAPGEMMVLVQPPDETNAPSSCDNTPYDFPDHPQGDLALETSPPGVRKLLVTLPDAASVAIIDAQRLIDQPPGSLSACPIERLLPLQANIPATLPQQRVAQGGFEPGKSVFGTTCELTLPHEISAGSGYTPRPAGMSYDASAKRLFIADESAPVIHVLDVSSPCDINELPPLLTMSFERPDRVVVTRKLAVSPTTSAGKKFLYASDLAQGSLMVFDVSLDSTDRTPLMRPFSWRDPGQPPDRIMFPVPVRDIEFVLRDKPAPNAASGVAAAGIRCNPADDQSAGALYRPSSDFTQGASPTNLRGVFALVALTNGQISIVDVDDFDAPCRRPTQKGQCAGDETGPYESYEKASGELSCNVVEPHQPRSSQVIVTSEDVHGSVTGVQLYPTLTLDTNTLPTDQTPEGLRNPKLLPPAFDTDPILVGGRAVTDVTSDPKTTTHNMVLFDLRNPRVQIDQSWNVSFEGEIPGFYGRFGRFDTTSDPWGRTTFFDAGAFFCDRGVHDQDAVNAIQALQDPSTITNPSTWASDHADVVQITEDFLEEDNDYWSSVADRCSWIQCRETFGLVRDPKPPRDLPIIKASQGELVIDGVYDFVRCCFPTVVSYTVRPRKQWVVTGSLSGFLHHVAVDPNTGQCIESCDPNRMLLNSRVMERPVDSPIPSRDDPSILRNPMMQFVVWSGQQPSTRGMTFSFAQRDGFTPLLMSVGGSSTFVQPQSIELAPTGELVVVDSSAQGLVFMDLGSLDVSRSFY